MMMLYDIREASAVGLMYDDDFDCSFTVQQVGLAYGPIRACSYSYTAQAAGPQRSPRKASLTPGSADAMREKSMFAAYIAASVGHS